MVVLHKIVFLPSGSLHLFLLHDLYCNRCFDQSPGQLPSPSAGEDTNFCLFLEPPSQSFEQRVHFVHGLSSQSFSHAAALQAFV